MDSGAEDNFVDEDLAAQLGVSLEPLSTPLTAKAKHGGFLAKITHQTAPVTLILSGNHRERISFLSWPPLTPQ